MKDGVSNNLEIENDEKLAIPAKERITGGK